MDDDSSAHAARLRRLDPLLPAEHDLPESEPGDRRFTIPGGSAHYRRVRLAREDFAALWGALDQHRLSVRLDTPDPAAMSALMSEWLAAVAAARPGPDAEALLTWPSRDTDVIPAITGHGMLPRTTLAVRPAGRPVPDGTGQVRVRPLAPADVGRVVELRMAALRWDARFGSCVVRPEAAAHFTAGCAKRLADRPGWTWVAEDAAGVVRGVLEADPPEHSAWVAGSTRAPAGYLGLLVVDEERRGRGIGAALVRAAQDALERSGAEVTLLHYAPLNPLSAPFWHRCGYRPLWTTWGRPAGRTS